MLRFCLTVAALLSVSPAFAQNWSFDARKIALGAVGGTENLASKMIDEQREYGSLVLPFGLIQVFKDFDRLDPGSDEFDLVKTVEYAAGPLHYVIGRDGIDTGNQLVVDIGNATLSRDLNDYRGFVPANQLAEGLASPSWGPTFIVSGSREGAFHGIYVGAGPYFSMRTDLTIDDRLREILGSTTPLYIPNAQFPLRDASQGQMALAVTGGYRGRFDWPAGFGSGAPREGLYVAANYNYLRGFRYEDVDLALRLDTDRGGLLTLNPFAPSPFVIRRDTAGSGQGFAIDAGVGAVVDRWEFGVGVNGIANRLNWTDVERTVYSLGNLFLGDDELLESPLQFIGDVRVELPVDYRTNVGYHEDDWSALAEIGRGFQGTSFRAGYEYRFERIELRGGTFYTRELWNPTGGVGFNMTDRVGFDVALYATAANAERERHPAIAVSLRFNRLP